MDRIIEYQGRLLNHLVTLYRPGERQLAIELAEAMGCAVTDTGSRGDSEETTLAVHPEPGDCNLQNNVFYMAPMPPEQVVLEARLKQVFESDGESFRQLESYRDMACNKPFLLPHFAMHLRSKQAVREASERVRQLFGERLGKRLSVRVFDHDPDDERAEVQSFIYQDVIVSGSFLHGQIIELQSQQVR